MYKTVFYKHFQSSSQDLNTIDTGKLQPDGNSTELDYHVTVEHFAENSSDIKVLRMTRKLDTGDPLDVPITVSYLSTLQSQQDGFTFTEVLSGEGDVSSWSEFQNQWRRPCHCQNLTIVFEITLVAVSVSTDLCRLSPQNHLATINHQLSAFSTVYLPLSES